MPDFEPRRTPFTDDSAMARTLFPGNDDPGELYDVIVVGSGAGGGTLAFQLASANPELRILVLEAGSFLFPTHTGNLPRRETGQRDEKSIWDMWWNCAVQRTGTDNGQDGSELRQGLNLGGRTLFWGALAPLPRRWELAAWPERVAVELRDVWLSRAEDLLRVRLLNASPYQNAVKRRLDEVLSDADGSSGDFSHVDAPMAIEYVGPTAGAVPAGIWSTPELLFDLARQSRDPKMVTPRVNLHREVVAVEHAGGAVTSVLAYDHVAHRDRRYHLADGGTVVLAAGTLGTPLVAKRSGLGQRLPKIGRGLTDHPIYVVKFVLRPGTPWFSRFESSKTLSRPRPTGEIGQRPDRPYNVLLELGSDLNQFRFLRPDEFPRNSGKDGMPGELVFLTQSPLAEENSIDFRDGQSPRQPDQPPDDALAVRINPAPVRTEALAGHLREVADRIIRGFDAEPYSSGWAPAGGVSHEVGTMRMGGADAVVDADLRILGCDNLYVCDLSVFPDSPAANPTLTLVALALRLAAHLASPRSA